MPIKTCGCTPAIQRKQIPVSHARINENDHRPQLEQGKGQTDKISRGLDHEHHPLASSHPFCLQIEGKGVSPTIEFLKA